MKVCMFKGFLSVLFEVNLDICDFGETDALGAPDDLRDYEFLTLLFMLAGPFELSLALCC